jgi:hypothetical protein
MDIVRYIEEHMRNDRDDGDEVCYLYLVQKGKQHSLAYSPSFYVLQIGHEHIRKLLKGYQNLCIANPSMLHQAKPNSNSNSSSR